MDSSTFFYWGAGLVAALALLLWPGRGCLRRWRRLEGLRERILLEDGLKHLYDCEYQKRTASVESLAGALEVPKGRAATVLIRLESLGLVSTQEHGMALTGYGREHHLSAEEMEKLSQEMGHPAYDPHGDPIPTAEGEVPPPRTVRLPALKEGELARIEHVEDEPEEVYRQLTEAGLHPGTRVQLVSAGEEEIRLVADGRSHSLPPVVAGNVFVHPVDGEMPGPYDSLDELARGERARVVGISPACRGLERRRLLDMGLLPGTEVRVEMVSPTGDPVAYQVRGATVALRRQQAGHIQVERDLPEAPPAAALQGKGSR